MFTLHFHSILTSKSFLFNEEMIISARHIAVYEVKIYLLIYLLQSIID